MTNSNKTFDFVVETKHKSAKNITIISILLLFFAYLIFVYTCYVQNPILNNQQLYKYYIIFVLSIVMLGYRLYRYMKNGILLLFWPIALSSFLWLAIPKLEWLCIIYILIAFVEKPLKTQTEYGFDTIGITVNTFPLKRYLWRDVSNALIKFGMLSIDLKSNTIIQTEINEDINFSLENEFNEFCKKQIENSNL